MRDPYTVLGLAQSATHEEIKASFRRLAKRLHPDGNPNDPQAASLFQDAQNAYALLKDPDQRLRYDRGLIDANGAPRSQPFPPRRRRAPPQATATASGPAAPPPPKPTEEEGEEALFSELFASLRRAKRVEPDPGGSGRSSARPIPAPLALTVSFEDALTGLKAPVMLPSGRKIMVTVPPGVEDGQIIRLKNGDGKGPGIEKAQEVRVRVGVAPHPLFTRTGLDLTCELAVSLPEAVLGAKVRIPTLHGEVMVQIPPGSNTGTVLKLRGRGVSRAPDETGDQLVTLRIVLPDTPDDDLAAFVRDWSQRHPYQVRR